MNDLKDNLNNVRARVRKACIGSGRDPHSVQILAVSKRHSKLKIKVLYDLGQTAFGENTVQEGLEKIRELADLNIEWHFIGPVQSNKTRDICRHFSWVHSVDRKKILTRLSAQRDPAAGPLNICIQVNIDHEPQKAGVTPECTAELAQCALDLPGIRLRGLMAIPRPDQRSKDLNNSFVQMTELFTNLRAQGIELDTLSMGMSADLESAVAAGSTMVRVGTDLLGSRTAVE